MDGDRSKVETAIREAALDYAEGYYDGDVERMERCLHPRLAKRQVSFDAASDQWVFEHYSKAELVGFTREGFGKRVPRDRLYYDVDVLDVYGNAAVVRCESALYLDYLQLAQEDGRWLIVNVLYTEHASVADA